MGGDDGLGRTADEPPTRPSAAFGPLSPPQAGEGIEMGVGAPLESIGSRRRRGSAGLDGVVRRGRFPRPAYGGCDLRENRKRYFT